MQEEKLVQMANQVAGFFQSYPDADATKGVAAHLKAFWTGRMRDALQQRVARSHDGVAPLVVRAMQDGGGEGDNPIRKELAGPGVVGQMTSDAG